MTHVTKGSDDRRGDEGRLDRLGRALVDAAAMTEAEAETTVSPFVSARVWARIAAERERRTASTWLDMWMIGRRVVPAMVTVAVALAAWLWIGSRSTGPIAAPRDPHLERVILTEAMTLSDDDMLAFLINWPVSGTGIQRDQQ